MKKLGDIMQEVGFRKDASDSVKEAFIKHLIKNATGVELQTPTEKKFRNYKKKSKTKLSKHPEPVQLSFEFMNSETENKKEKVS